MSKEMTPKEALQMIQDNLTPRVLGIFPVEFHIVKEALDRLELLEKENQELETDKKMLNALYQEVKDTASFYMSKCEKFEKVIAWLKNTFEITLDSKVRISDGTDCIQAFPIDLKTNEVIYDLLKEVLESV